jgi:hypothetical protein
MDEHLDGYEYAAELGALGYPEFSYLKGTTSPDPTKLLLRALNEPNLDSRIAEGLPWLVWSYVDMDWIWLVENAKVTRRQNRLGFVVSLATELARRKNNRKRASELRHQLEILEMSRLSEEDTFCHDSMTEAERVWAREHRSPAAAHWNLLTDMRVEQLSDGSLP